MSLLEAKVKSVLSGDTVILHNINNPKQERTLSLAYVTAPRMRREGDEVCDIPSSFSLHICLVYTPLLSPSAGHLDAHFGSCQSRK